MKIAISGANGLLGRAIQEADTTGRHTFIRLVRHETDKDHEVQWDPQAEVCDTAGLEHLDAVIHLAGENVADGLWTKEKKKRIRDSRVSGTRLLVDSLLELKHPPSVFICASAVGYYGDRPGEELTEESAPGSGFLSDVCVAWEGEANRATQAPIRTVNLRIGLVLSARGGAFAKMKLPFSMGLGGPLGSGTQRWSWISLMDLVRSIYFCLEHNIEGPVNAVSPDPIENKEFTRILGKALSRPTILPAPSFALKLLLREFAEEALLADTACVPKKLLDHGFTFDDRDLQSLFTTLIENQEQFTE